MTGLNAFQLDHSVCLLEINRDKENKAAGKEVNVGYVIVIQVRENEGKNKGSGSKENGRK